MASRPNSGHMVTPALQASWMCHQGRGCKDVTKQLRPIGQEKAKMPDLSTKPTLKSFSFDLFYLPLHNRLWVPIIVNQVPSFQECHVLLGF